MPRSGTLVICVQNLDFSGANQAILNIVAGRIHESNIVIISPKVGSFAARFVQSGATVKVGETLQILLRNEICNVFCIICNTIMTADIVVEMSHRDIPVIWILHEWWDDDMIIENLRIRNIQGLTLETIKSALVKSSQTVFVCERQRQLYHSPKNSCVIFVGVPDPRERSVKSTSEPHFNENTLINYSDRIHNKTTFDILCLGIVCPRKNQVWAVEIFKEFAKKKSNVRLHIVGARETRLYEMEYLEKVKEAIGNDANILLHNVTEDVDSFFYSADCLLLTSTNEVTPMVLPEAMSWGIPLLSTNIAGIKEMFTQDTEGFMFPPGETQLAVEFLNRLYYNKDTRSAMGQNARKKYESTFKLSIMSDKFRQLLIEVSPPTILVDMDGVIVDWDKGFLEVWNALYPDKLVNRENSYFMEDCVPPHMKESAIAIFSAEGFFQSLPPMEGALFALNEMVSAGLKVNICTSPIMSSRYCAQEKLNWIKNQLGDSWVSKTILCFEKDIIRGDILIDDKPLDKIHPSGKHLTATWKQIVFDAPYNRANGNDVASCHVKLYSWSNWRNEIYPLVGKPMLSANLSFRSDTITNQEMEMKKEFLQDEHHQNLRLHHQMSKSDEVRFNIQSVQDCLQVNKEPLSPEEFATIKSCSGSLLEDGNEDIREDDMFDQTKKGRILAKSILKASLEEKKKKYNEAIEKFERKLVQQSDPADIEGLQIFRDSYRQWRVRPNNNQT
eukprot:gene10577-14207_t